MKPVPINWISYLFLALCLTSIICRTQPNLDSEDYYEILGVDKGSSTEDIKRAFRKLARKYHPDKSDEPDAEDKFKKIGNAYGVLSDEEKRRMYDVQGAGGSFGQFRPDSFDFRNFNFDDLFSNFDDDDDFFGHGGSFGGSHSKMFQDFPSFFDDEDDDHRFGSGRSYFADHVRDKSSGSQHLHQRQQGSGRSCTTVTQRIGNTVTTYTTCT